MTNTKISKDDARTLAIAYSGFMSAHPDDDAGVVAWGRTLRRVQERTGIELIELGLLARCIEDAKAAIVKREREAFQAQRAIARQALDMIARDLDGSKIS